MIDRRSRTAAAAAALCGVLLAALPPADAVARRSVTKGVPNAALAAAARHAPVRDIDYDERHCDGATTIGAWLAALVRPDAAKIAWTGGSCTLSDAMNPIDSGSDWCADATITLLHPRDTHDNAVVEIYFDAPKNGKPGPVYAFRAVFQTVNGDDTFRFRKDFARAWRERFPRADDPQACKDDDGPSIAAPGQGQPSRAGPLLPTGFAGARVRRTPGNPRSR